MKRINVLLLMIVFCIGSVLSANARNAEEGPDAVKVEIEKLLEDHNLELKKDVVTKVLFTLNTNNEVVVLLVDCRNEDVKDYIKSRLNYKKIKSSMDSDFDKVVMSVRIKA